MLPWLIHEEGRVGTGFNFAPLRWRSGPQGTACVGCLKAGRGGPDERESLQWGLETSTCWILASSHDIDQYTMSEAVFSPS
ncbi:hypothetical protein chiPu_0001226 [Chiloscyllium punctatum]|uniref:Uncharacterized protein n=1 Tax=Chiloscyllium punctatum TaxID=137246 RepID=A0A401RXG2_CHIPU|nr:hypothetical protein [Chiloscyllium punctatum]